MSVDEINIRFLVVIDRLSSCKTNTKCSEKITVLLTQSDPTPSHVLENATQPNPTQPNPWMDPTHVHLCVHSCSCSVVWNCSLTCTCVFSSSILYLVVLNRVERGGVCTPASVLVEFSSCMCCSFRRGLESHLRLSSHVDLFWGGK